MHRKLCPLLSQLLSITYMYLKNLSPYDSKYGYNEKIIKQDAAN